MARDRDTLIKLPGRIALQVNGDGRDVCGACRYFQSNGPDPQNLTAPEMGTCVRFPPSAFVVGMQQTPNGAIPMVARARPPVQASETCGEFTIA